MSEAAISEDQIHSVTVYRKTPNEQQRLLASIGSNEHSVFALNGFEAQGVNIYRRNLFANAQRALSLSFPTLFALLDSDVSENLTKQFLRFSPPAQGDWSQWGADFSGFIKATEIAQDYPYLADCAALDWRVHIALQGKDQILEVTSLQLLANCEPEQLVIIFNENVHVLSSYYPLVEIFDAHHQPENRLREVALSSAQHALSSTLIEHDVMIYRPEFQPRVNRLSRSEGRFMLALMAKKSLSEALDLVCDDESFSFETWLLNAIKHNLIHYLKETSI